MTGALARRQLLHGATIIAVAQALPLILSRSAVAQTVGDEIAHLTPSQRILLNGVLYKDPIAYLAFASVVGKNSRGAAAQATFDREVSVIAKLAPDDKDNALKVALSQRIALDCTLSANMKATPTTLSGVLSAATPRIGFSGLFSYAIGLQIPQEARTTIADPSTLISQIGVAKLVTIAPSASKYAADGLQLLNGDGDLQGIFAQGAIALANSTHIPAKAQQIVASLSQTATSIKDMVDGFGAAISSQAGQPPNPTALATEAEAAMTALGHAVGMNPATVQKVNTALQVAGSALSGAMMGAAVGGPIGAAVGGVIGLLGGLFGGGGEDPTAQMISQLDSSLTDLQKNMMASFQAINAQIGGLEQEMQSAFGAVSSQLQHLTDNIDKSLAQVRGLIIHETQQQLQTTIDNFINTGNEYERRYRIAILGGPAATDAESQWHVAASSFLDLISMQGSGFTQGAFIADEYADYSAMRQDLCTHLQSDSGLHIVDNFTGRPIQVGGSSGSSGLRSVALAIQRLSARLPDPRYGVAADGTNNLKADSNGASLVNFIHSVCIAALDGLKSSPEWATLTADQQVLVPTKAPPALAPQDLLTIAITAQNVTTTVSDFVAARDILSACYNSLLPHIAAHSLLVSQSSIPMLLYARRRVAAQLANHAATVFCNPFMAAVDVLRRAFSTAASDGLTYGPHSAPPAFQVKSKQQALSLLNTGRALMPLADVATAALPAAMSQTSNVSQSLDRFFTNLPPAGLSRFSYIGSGGAFERDVLAVYLPDAVNSIDGKTLFEHLDGILYGTIVLGVIENCILNCLKTLQHSGSPVPSFATWTSGFLPYATVAASGLAQPASSAGQPAEYNVSRAVLQSLLTGGSTILSPFLPAGVPPVGLPFPWQIGDFWGWGVELCRPNDPSDPGLITSLMRPEASVANPNSPIMSATEALAVIKATLVQYEGADLMLTTVTRSVGNNVRSLLRAQLSA